MMLSVRFCAALALLPLIALVSAARAQGNNLPDPSPQSPPLPVPGVAGSDGFIYVLGKPEMVASGRVTKVLPNPTGRYTLVLREEEPLPPDPALGNTNTGGVSLLLWDSIAREAHPLWEQAAYNGTRRSEVSDVGWFYGTDCVAAVASVDVIPSPRDEGHKPTFTLLYGDVSRESRLHSIFTSPERIRLSMSEKLPFGVVQDQPKESLPFEDIPPEARKNLQFSQMMNFLKRQLPTERSRLLNARGRFVSEFPTFSHVEPFIWWSADSSTVGIMEMQLTFGSSTENTRDTESEPTLKMHTVQHWYSINPATGVLTPASEPKPLARGSSPEPAAPLRFRASSLEVRPEKDTRSHSTHLNALWLTAGRNAAPPPSPPSPQIEESLLVAADASEPILLPDRRGILYRSGDALYSVPLIRMSVKEFTSANRKALIRQTLNNAWQIAQAISSYTQDNDKTYPPSGNITDTLNKYVKDTNVFNNPATGAPGFTYLLHGGGVADVDGKNGVLVGSLSGPDGRADIYSWGNVQWHDNLPSQAH